MGTRFLVLHHHQETICPQCEESVASPNTKSYVLDSSGEIVFARNQYPFPLAFSVRCSNGHRVPLPSTDALLHGSTHEPPSDSERKLAVTLETRLP